MLIACMPVMGWRDTTGGNRDQSVAKDDMRICEAKADLAKISDIPAEKRLAERHEIRKAIEQFDVCMADSGWEPDKKAWQDTKGQNRSYALASEAENDCDDQAGFGPDEGSAMTKDQLSTAKQKKALCMTNQGWKRVDGWQ